MTEIVDAGAWISDIDMASVAGRVIASSGDQNEQGAFVGDLYPGSEDVFWASVQARQGDVYVHRYGLKESAPDFDELSP